MVSEKQKKGIPIDISADLTTTKATIYDVPTGYILEIDEIVINNDGTAGVTTLTDEGTYQDGTTSYSKTVHKEYLEANGFDDTKDMNVRVFASLKGATSAGTSTVIVKGRLI